MKKWKWVEKHYILKEKIVERRLKEGFNVFANIEWIKLDDYFSTYGAGEGNMKLLK